MALPSKGDPDRPLHLAARSMNLLALILVLFGILGVVGAALGGSAFIIAITVVYLGIGIGFRVSGRYLVRHRRWALIVGIVLASLALLGSVLALVADLAALILTPGRTIGLSFAIAVIMVAAFGQLLYHLVLGFEAISAWERRGGTERERGFEPIMAQPIDSERPK
ncbi:MAG: hypothetical protein AAF561_01270 [Planctomycetota bacterium]